MTPEATLLDAVLSGRLPGFALAVVLAWWVITRGSVKIDALTAAVASVAPALTEHRTETTSELRGLRQHTTEQIDRVRAHVSDQVSALERTIHDHRMSQLEDAVVTVSRSGSIPDAEPSQPARRLPTGSYRAVR